MPIINNIIVQYYYTGCERGFKNNARINSDGFKGKSSGGKRYNEFIKSNCFRARIFQYNFFF